MIPEMLTILNSFKCPLDLLLSDYSGEKKESWLALGDVSSVPVLH